VIVGSPKEDARGICPKYGFGTRFEQRRADGKLIHGQLIYAYIRHAYVGNLRSGIRHFDNQITFKLALNRDVPLLG
jgi:hypothetical protein